MSDKGTELPFKIEASSFPNLNGEVNVRPFQLKGDELGDRQSCLAVGWIGSNVEVWKRQIGATKEK